MTSPSTPTAPRRGETAGLWMVKIFTGPLLVLLLIVHFTVNHMVAESGLLSWADVIRYFDNPFVPFMEITFLTTVVTHSLLGVRSIILDMNPSRSLLRIIDWALLLFGAAAILYGGWLALTVAGLSV